MSAAVPSKKKEPIRFREYFYRYDHLMLLSLMFDDDMIAYLRCSYKQEQFARELERLERLCGNFAS